MDGERFEDEKAYDGAGPAWNDLDDEEGASIGGRVEDERKSVGRSRHRSEQSRWRRGREHCEA